MSSNKALKTFARKMRDLNIKQSANFDHIKDGIKSLKPDFEKGHFFSVMSVEAVAVLVHHFNVPSNKITYVKSSEIKANLIEGMFKGIQVTTSKEMGALMQKASKPMIFLPDVNDLVEAKMNGLM